MYKELTLDRKKNIKDPVSLFQATEEEKGVILCARKDWQQGIENQTKSRHEFNDRSIIQEIDINQQAFNSYVPPRSDDPDLSWRAQTVRPVTRNKLISIAAHVTTTILYPGVFARDQRDEEDTMSAYVMRDLIEYVIDNSDYSKEFITGVIQMLVDPYMVIHEDFYEVMREIKVLKENGEYDKKKVIDDIISGFSFNVIPAKEILFANFYEANIQKQRFIIRNRYIDHADAEVLYGDHKNFQYVKPGVRTVFNEENTTFYDVKDDSMRQHQDNEVTYYNRFKDLEVIFLNGIPVTAPDRPLRRKDKKYPFAKSGYEPIGNGKCFCYKSAANKLGSDQDIVDALYNLVLDGSFLAIMPPMALYGSESYDSSVSVPGTVTAFKDPNVKLESLAPRSDIRAALEATSLVEKSMSESTQSSERGGVGGDTARTAREVLMLDANARASLGLFGKSIKFLVEDLGDLLVGDILQHMTVAEVGEIAGDVKFKAFILNDKIEDGKKVTKKIQLANPADFMGDTTDMEWELLAKEGGINGDKKIIMVNPEAFREIKFKTRISADDFTPPNKALEKALNLEAYDRAIQNPVIDQEAITRDFLLNVYKPGEGDKYIKKAAPAPEQGMAIPGEPLQQKGVNTNLVSQLTGGNSLGVAASSAME